MQSYRKKYNKNLYNTEKKNKGTAVLEGKVKAIKTRDKPSTVNTLKFKREPGMLVLNDLQDIHHLPDSN